MLYGNIYFDLHNIIYFLYVILPSLSVVFSFYFAVLVVPGWYPVTDRDEANRAALLSGRMPDEVDRDVNRLYDHVGGEHLVAEKGVART